MKQLYSKQEPGLLLHEILHFNEIEKGQTNLSEPKEFLQVMVQNIDLERTFHPHKHLWKDCEPKTIAQEVWVIVRGKVKGEYYDIDGTLLDEEILETGDCSITFQGGHNLIVLEKDTIFYEIKTGPYQGKEKDKVEF